MKDMKKSKTKWWFPKTPKKLKHDTILGIGEDDTNIYVMRKGHLETITSSYFYGKIKRKE